ncbi:Rossmann-like and DUF2520 domain-containing protein [Gordonia westfalica]|uniref:Predicted oxidoreductase, contains short-chain dehydrogenase (SDR) and DUF2520 domains n=1 Tax=Gordonia westfalica TaxID=158898 RepID=A0A1H2LK36_9ACTN|nr:DUF2520 domain-containing protein [Gordonia westfalica]SDU81390.1 Predicted oxidoreductase, contains short-chain dehydrogenase (SDR) and DUF2520 domains [Gordonia westfalica]
MTSPTGDPGVPFARQTGGDDAVGSHADSAFGDRPYPVHPDPFPGTSNLPAPARLTVGIVSAGRVGTALGEALEKAGHVVGAVVARSAQSRERVAQRLPDSEILELDAVVARSELLLVSVPDAELTAVIDEIAESGSLRPGTIVAHTAGAQGVDILTPVTARGALGLALHPAMTFVGTAEDTARLTNACFAITAADPVGEAIASSLVLEMGGEPVRIAEADRMLYHAALAHGANHLIALISDAVASLNAAIDHSGRDVATVDGSGARLAERILTPLVTASLSNVLDLGPSALTGPVARGDAEAVRKHLVALRALPGGAGDHGIAEAYRTMARRAAERTDAPADLLDLLEER